MHSSLTFKKALHGLLKRIEAEKPTGLVRLRAENGDVVGRIMVGAGRLCFATAVRGRSRRSDEPALVPKLSRALEDACRRGVKLSEAILAQGASDVEAVRRALRMETARAVIDILRACTGHGPEYEVRETRDDYDPRLTFTPLDVFLGAAETLDELPVDSAGKLHHEFQSTADVGLLFMRTADEGTPLPLAARGLEERSLDDLVKISRAAAEISSPPALAAAGVEPAVGVRVLADGVWVSLVGPLRVAIVRTPREKHIVGRIVRRAFELARAKTLAESA